MKTKRLNSASAHRQRGISLVEMILYIALLAILVSSFTLAAVSLLGTYARMRANQELAQASTFTLERLTREVRFANAVDLGSSVLGTHPSTLALTTTDAGGAPADLVVALNGGRLTLSENAGSPIPLTPSDITVSNFTVSHALGTETQAVRIELTLEKNVRGATLSEQFRTFVVLDAS